MTTQADILTELRRNLYSLRNQLREVDHSNDCEEWKNIQRRYIRLLIIKAEELIQVELNKL